MTQENNLGDTPKDLVGEPATPEIMARIAKIWLDQTPDKLVEAGELALVTSNNHLLDAYYRQRAEACTQEYGNIPGKWYKRGVCFAIMYFNGVAEDIQGRSLTVITQQDIDQFVTKTQAINREKLIDSEFLLGEELETRREERVKRLFDEEMNRPLVNSLMRTLGELDKSLDIPSKIMFLNGAVMVDQMFKPYFSS